LLNSEDVTSEQLHGLLNMQPDEAFTQGKLVCSCFKVGENTIVDAIKGGCDSVDSLGKQLKCGTNCGSCKSELSQMVKQHKSKKRVIEHDPFITLEALS
jgi:assimilatory nitrate reductase catalytic subunit